MAIDRRQLDAQYDVSTSRAVLDTLAYFRVLTEPPQREDPENCRQAISAIRDYLRSARTRSVPGRELKTSLSRMLDACLDFLRAAGQDSANFTSNLDYFHALLANWREVMRQEIYWQAEEYNISLDRAFADKLQ